MCESVSLQSLSQSFSPPVGQSVSLSLIGSFHSFKFPVNFPDVDVGFAISAASADSDKIFSLMKQIINTIVDRYGVNKVRFSFIVYGSRVTTRFTFDNAPITQEELIKAVNGTEKVTGDPDLEKALEEAEQLFTKTSRPNATRVFVVLTDIVGSGDDNSLIATSARLRKGGVLILSVGFGQQVNAISNQMTKVVIAQSDYISVPDFTTQRPVVIAETIMFKALQGKYNFKCVPLMPRD